MQEWGAGTDPLKDSMRARGWAPTEERTESGSTKPVAGAEPGGFSYRKTKSALLISLPQRLFFRIPPLPTTAHFLN